MHTTTQTRDTQRQMDFPGQNTTNRMDHIERRYAHNVTNKMWMLIGSLFAKRGI